MLQTGTILEKRYRLVGQMASGGFADIYVGSDMRLGNKPVVIKMLRRDFTEDRERIRMFVDEINLTTRLDHENIVRVYDVIRTEKDTYIQVMELIDGADFKQIINDARQRNERIPFDLVAYIISKVCLALDYAHDKKDTATGNPLHIVHRDISPHNILISYDGKVKLMDFGIAFAQLHQRQKTRMGELKGKIAYMSPEQAKAKPVDRRSDIYSLGIVMYEALTGKRLFDGDSDIEVLQKVAEGYVDFKPIDDAVVPETMREVLLRSLQKKVSARYENAFEMYTDLQGFLSSTEEYSLRSKLKNYLFGLKRETRLSQLLAILKGKTKEEELSFELTLPPEMAEAEEAGEERTIYDLIRLQTGRQKKVWTGVGISLLIATLAFAGIDTFYLQRTPVGRGIYNRFFPPALTIESIPPGARVRLDDRVLDESTPLSLSKIQTGTHVVELKLDGYNPIKRTIAVEEKEKEGSKGTQTVLIQFEMPLTIRSNPAGAEIYFDNRAEAYPKPTPIQISHPLKTEPLQIRLEIEGFEEITMSLNLLEEPANSKDRRWKFRRESNEAGVFHYDLLGQFYSEVKVTSIPKNALVTVIENGERSDPLPTPVTLLLVAGKNLLVVEKDNLIPWKKEVFIKSGEPRTLTAVLKQEVVFKVYEGQKEKQGVSIRIHKQGKRISSGKTPLIDSLEVGKYQARFNAPEGFKPIRSISFSVPGEKTVTAKLTQADPLLEVTVIDARTRRPLQGATVWLKIREGEEGKTYSASDGTYQKKIPPGKFYVAATKQGYEPSSYEERVIQWPSGTEVTIELKRERGKVSPPAVTFEIIPNLFGRTPGPARYAVQKLGFKFDLKHTTDKKQKYGIIIRQEPKAGTQVTKGSTVRVWVNRKK